MNDINLLFDRLNQLLDRLEPMLPVQNKPCDWQAPAYYWRNTGQGGYLQPVYEPHYVDLSTLQNVEQQKQAILRNTTQFAQGLPANNILLTGARGTGKSTLIKSCWYTQKDQVKLIEIDKPDLKDLGQLLSLLTERQEDRFIVFCDDLSFEDGDHNYKALKSALDGSIIAPGDNVLFYATSNRRHLLPHKMKDNLETDLVDGDIRPGDSIEEKTSLSERFGLWLSFYPFSQNEYLTTAKTWIESLGGTWNDDVREAALRWSMTRGARSGRVAWQFARDYIGSQKMG